ncbi:MAG: hypothetical protein KIT83_15120 [Bryobacterales bacterium]|nr:hypothetical protein [Bryobacterales bacterium]
MDELERGIHAFVAHRRARLAALQPDEGQGRNRLFLRLAAEERNFPITQTHGILRLQLKWTVPALTALVVAVLLVLHTTLAPSVSAKELLQQSARAELASPGPIPAASETVLRVARHSGDHWETALVSQSDPSMQAGEGEVVADLHGWLEAMGLEWDIGLSAARFQEWATGLRATLTAETVERRGEPFWRIRAVAPAPAGSQLEMALFVRSSDMLPVEHRLVFHRDGQVVIYVLSKEPLPLTMRVSKAKIPQHSVVPEAVVPTMQPPQAPLPPARWQLDEIAVEAHEILHRLNLSLAGTITVAVEAKEVLVRGVVETAAERVRVEELFADRPLLRAEIWSAEEAVTSATNVLPTVLPADDSFTQSAAFRKEVEEYLAARLCPTLAPEEAFREVSRFGSESLENSRSLTQHSWAFRRLRQQFLPGQVERLSPAHAVLLHEMAAHHVRGMNEDLDRLRLHLLRVLPVDISRLPGLERFEPIVDASERIDRLSRVLFAGLPHDGSVAAVAGELAAAVESSQQHLATQCSPFLDLLQQQAQLSAQPKPMPIGRIQP